MLMMHQGHYTTTTPPPTVCPTSARATVTAKTVGDVSPLPAGERNPPPALWGNLGTSASLEDLVEHLGASHLHHRAVGRLHAGRLVALAYRRQQQVLDGPCLLRLRVRVRDRVRARARARARARVRTKVKG